jgi:hypothetical protein
MEPMKSAVIKAFRSSSLDIYRRSHIPLPHPRTGASTTSHQQTAGLRHHAERRTWPPSAINLTWVAVRSMQRGQGVPHAREARAWWNRWVRGVVVAPDVLVIDRLLPWCRCHRRGSPHPDLAWSGLCSRWVVVGIRWCMWRLVVVSSKRRAFCAAAIARWRHSSAEM